MRPLFLGEEDLQRLVLLARDGLEYAELDDRPADDETRNLVDRLTRLAAPHAEPKIPHGLHAVIAAEVASTGMSDVFRWNSDLKRWIGRNHVCRESELHNVEVLFEGVDNDPGLA